MSVRPGITDSASLRFANEGEILSGALDPDKEYMEKIHPEKMRLSLEYVRSRSFGRDTLRLVDLTPSAGLTAEPSSSTTPGRILCSGVMTPDGQRDS